jgi:hypothetical protein
MSEALSRLAMMAGLALLGGFDAPIAVIVIAAAWYYLGGGRKKLSAEEARKWSSDGKGPTS